MSSSCWADGSLPGAGDESRRVRAGLIRLLLLGDDPGYRLHEAGLRIGGAWIPDALDLEGCRDLRDIWPVQLPVRRGAGLAVGVCLANLFLTGSHLPGLSADRMEVRGSVSSAASRRPGRCGCSGRSWAGTLDCTGATFRAEKDAEGNPGHALSADGLEAGAAWFWWRRGDGCGAAAGAKLGGTSPASARRSGRRRMRRAIRGMRCRPTGWRRGGVSPRRHGDRGGAAARGEAGRGPRLRRCDVPGGEGRGGQSGDALSADGLEAGEACSSRRHGDRGGAAARGEAGRGPRLQRCDVPGGEGCGGQSGDCAVGRRGKGGRYVLLAGRRQCRGRA